MWVVSWLGEKEKKITWYCLPLDYKWKPQFGTRKDVQNICFQGASCYLPVLLFERVQENADSTIWNFHISNFSNFQRSLRQIWLYIKLNQSFQIIVRKIFQNEKYTIFAQKMFNDGRRRLICLLRDYFDTLLHHYHNIPQVHDRRKRSLCNQSEHILFSLKQFHFFCKSSSWCEGEVGGFSLQFKTSASE